MSMEMMVLVNKHRFDSPLKKLIFLQLADNADKSGRCWPSHSYIAETSGCGKSTVRKHIKELHELGYLRVKNRKTDKGNTSNEYTIIKEKLMGLPMPPDSTGGCYEVAQGVPPDSTGVCHEVAEGVPPNSTPLCHQVAPEPVTIEPVTIEPVIESKDVQIVFDHWRNVMDHKRAKLDNKRKGKIKSALKLFTVEECLKAIYGCSLSPFHMGENESMTRYDSIDLIFRGADYIEKFMAIADNPPPKPKANKTKIIDEIMRRLSAGQNNTWQWTQPEAEQLFQKAMKVATLWNLKTSEVIRVLNSID